MEEKNDAEKVFTKLIGKKLVKATVELDEVLLEFEDGSTVAIGKGYWEGFGADNVYLTVDGIRA